ncbi:MAG: hypothetical protein MJE77_10300 [Proteobacteria bacterium]|nr:hypothetical protein [Pseudomonadota bacterium]
MKSANFVQCDLARVPVAIGHTISKSGAETRSQPESLSSPSFRRPDIQSAKN